MPRTILIVEDTDLCRDSLEVALMGLAETGLAELGSSGLGTSELRVRAVETAEQALAILDQEDVCALITDLHLASRSYAPHANAQDGFDLIAALRSSPRYTALPVIVTSGDTDPGTAARLASLGVKDYFSKPYSPGAVRSRLEQLIRKSEGMIAENSLDAVDHQIETETEATGGLPSA